MRKKSVKKASDAFVEELEQIDGFLGEIEGLSDRSVSWTYDYAVIRLYRAFEDFILSCLIAAINNDTSQISASTDVKFPKHLSDEVCEYIIVGGGYFDFKGRDGLIKTVKDYVVSDHYLLVTIKNKKYKEALERLSALRNFAAHDSRSSKKRALEAINADKISSCGAWLKKQGRFPTLTDKLEELAREIADAAPF
jgi:hypothetical protein